MAISLRTKNFKGHGIWYTLHEQQLYYDVKFSFFRDQVYKHSYDLVWKELNNLHSMFYDLFDSALLSTFEQIRFSNNLVLQSMSVINPCSLLPQNINIIDYNPFTLSKFLISLLHSPYLSEA